MPRTTQVRLGRSAVLALRKRALELGFVLRRGALAGDGDTAAMLEAVARGELGIEQIRLRQACEQLIGAMVQLGKEHHREVAFARDTLGLERGVATVGRCDDRTGSNTSYHH